MAPGIMQSSSSETVSSISFFGIFFLKPIFFSLYLEEGKDRIHSAKEHILHTTLRAQCNFGAAKDSIISLLLRNEKGRSLQPKQQL